jgi:hypothetical protein
MGFGFEGPIYTVIVREEKNVCVNYGLGREWLVDLTGLECGVPPPTERPM